MQLNIWCYFLLFYFIGCFSFCYPAVLMLIALSKTNELSLFCISVTHVWPEWFGCEWHYILTEQKCKTEVAMETDGIQWEKKKWVWLVDWQAFRTCSLPSVRLINNFFSLLPQRRGQRKDSLEVSELKIKQSHDTVLQKHSG